MITKICVKCGQEKPIVEFGNDSHRRDKHRVYCKVCDRNDGKIYRINHKKKAHEYYLKTKTERRKKQKIYEAQNKERINQIKYNYRKRHPEKRKEQSRNYYIKYKEKIRKRTFDNREINNKKSVERIRNNPQARIAHNLRSRIGNVINGHSNGGRLCLLIGCNIDFLKKHLESLWEGNMSWSNYGKGIDRWSIDHVIPIDYFDITDTEQQKKCFNWTNLQPMWYSENCSKSNRYNGKYKG